MLIFFFGSHTASDMALSLIDIQNHSGLRRQRRVDILQAIGHIFMYR